MITEYTPSLQALASLAGTVVWFLFLQVTVSSLRQTQKPRILLSLGPGLGPESNVIVANHCESPIYLVAIRVRIQNGDGTSHEYSIPIEDFPVADTEDATAAYGMLQAGRNRSLGSLNHHIDLARGKEPGAAEVQSVSVRVAAYFGVDLKMIGAETSFALGEKDQKGNRLAQHRVKQLGSFRYRRQLAEMTQNARGTG